MKLQEVDRIYGIRSPSPVMTAPDGILNKADYLIKETLTHPVYEVRTGVLSE